MIKIFYSYSSKDERLIERLDTQLSTLKRDNIIDIWDKRRIIPGHDINFEINKNISISDIIFFLLSQDFLASDYCYHTEVTYALDRNRAKLAHAIPILLRPCEWQYTRFRTLQILPRNRIPIMKWKNKDDAFLEISTSIRSLIGDHNSNEFIKDNTNYTHNISVLQSNRDNKLADDNLYREGNETYKISIKTPNIPDSSPDANVSLDFGRDEFGIWLELVIGAAHQKLRWIDPGKFWMGSAEDEFGHTNEEEPRHEVDIDNGFWIFDTPCTQHLWQVVMGFNPSYYSGLDLPVERVSWDDVQIFLQKINAILPALALKLPAETEWEYACRAGTVTPFGLGNEITPSQANFNGARLEGDDIPPNWRHKTVQVYSYPCNAWGLYDMHGNVWEWCSDLWRPSYHNNLLVDPDQRVHRGGSWFDYAQFLRSAYRAKNFRSEGHPNIGFRCISDQNRLHPLDKPFWASAIGTDNFGPWAEVIFGHISQKLRWIGSGKFFMGSPESEKGHFPAEGPQHEVIVKKGFWIFDTACTQELWLEITGNNPSKNKKHDNPVENVSWHDVQVFIKLANNRIQGLLLSLPSESQWEYACRGGTTTAFSFGDKINTSQANFNGDTLYEDSPIYDFRGETISVASIAPNAWGLYQMHGNVLEWCADSWHPNYSKKFNDDKPWCEIGASSYVCRGGSWRSKEHSLRSARRYSFEAKDRNDEVGFRCIIVN